VISLFKEIVDGGGGGNFGGNDIIARDLK